MARLRTSDIDKGNGISLYNYETKHDGLFWIESKLSDKDKYFLDKVS